MGWCRHSLRSRSSLSLARSFSLSFSHPLSLLLISTSSRHHSTAPCGANRSLVALLVPLLLRLPPLPPHPTPPHSLTSHTAQRTLHARLPHRRRRSSRARSSDQCASAHRVYRHREQYVWRSGDRELQRSEQEPRNPRRTPSWRISNAGQQGRKRARKDAPRLAKVGKASAQDPGGRGALLRGRCR